MKNTLFLFTIIELFFVSIGTTYSANYTMPFGIAIIPDATLAISDVHDSPAGDREESIARFATKTSRQSVITFYRKALKEAGFEIYSSSDQTKYAMIAAKRGGDRVTIYYKNKSDWVKEDESEFSFKAIYKK
jgi:hypothetical protein